MAGAALGPYRMLHCRIGSSENSKGVRVFAEHLHCRIGSSEMAELLHGGLAYLRLNVQRVFANVRQGQPVNALAVAEV